ncbi:DUF4127 family protein [Carboxydochorda subterranea]|uniref:DUF4127 family protein n=1 Tax=Carboxydichorda subterranea TaxID=3109565 RepID=A0ABZ1BZR3_9FIRM|nr:DUF4127 family protein [Limnochorda sp. L945t]WRP17587.1 DUF4127 family protein [Limnochorda sp. L945t]
MRRVALLPLDERPCNHAYPVMLGAVAGIEVAVPPKELMGRKKEPADTRLLGDWLRAESERADGLIVAAETLAFGGLIPSRVVGVSEEEALKRLDALRRIRQRRPELPIFVQSVILRTPGYDSDDEEPGYWASYGKRLYVLSVAEHAVELGPRAWDALRKGGEAHLPPVVAQELGALDFDGVVARRAALEAEVPAGVRQDWRWRRARNHQVNRALVELVAEGVVDFLVLTQDDSPPIGLHAREQQALAALVAQRGVHRRVRIHPGADETALVLLARQALRDRGLRPRVGVRFSSIAGPGVVPLYEDRPLMEGIKGHVTALGALLSPDFGESELALFVNSPDGPQHEAPLQALPGESVGKGRNLPEFLDALQDALERRPERPAALADVAYANGADRELVEMLPAYLSPWALGAYAGWNTASNTIGTALAHAALRLVARGLGGDERVASERAHRSFLALRFTEDWGYQAVVRQELVEAAVRLGVSPYALGSHREALAERARERLQATMDRWPGAASGSPRIRVERVDFPWDRLFEVALGVRIDAGP